MARAKRALAQGMAAKVASIPAPVGVWIARDSIESMDPMDAHQLTNFFSSVSKKEITEANNGPS